MSKTKKTVLILISALAILLCIACCLYIYQFFRGRQVHEQLSNVAMTVPPQTMQAEPEAAPVPSVSQSKSETEAENTPTTLPEQVPEAEQEEAPAPEDNSVEIPIDFVALSQVNEEIYAWLEIPGTTISYAIVQSNTDDLFYNNHGVDKIYYTGGSIYTQRYNSKTFDDPMTLVYGHNFHDQSLFAPLLNFADADFFRNNRQILIYTPDTVYQYEIFAAYSHTSEHLLLCYDFSDETQFHSYFDSLPQSMVNANFDREAFPDFGNRVLTLSTCYRLSFGRRFLVQAVLAATYPVAKETT